MKIMITLKPARKLSNFISFELYLTSKILFLNGFSLYKTNIEKKEKATLDHKYISQISLNTLSLCKYNCAIYEESNSTATKKEKSTFSFFVF